MIPFVDSYIDGHLPEGMVIEELKQIYKNCFEKVLQEKWKEACKWEQENWNANQP